MKNLIKLNEFKSQKKGDKLIKEMVQQIGDNYVVTAQIAVPRSLVKAYIKKVKDATQVDLSTQFGEQMIAETIVTWLNSNLLIADNLPTNILTSASAPVQVQNAQNAQQTAQQIQPVQTQTQTQPVQAQTAQVQTTQTQPTQIQPVQTQTTQTQPTQTQDEI